MFSITIKRIGTLICAGMLFISNASYIVANAAEKSKTEDNNKSVVDNQSAQTQTRRVPRDERPFVLEKTTPVNDCKVLIKRFLDEDYELLNSIVLTHNEITKFKPTERTWTEFQYRLRQGKIGFAFGNDVVTENELALYNKIISLEMQRYEKDFKTDFRLLDRTTVEKNLNSFEILDISGKELELFVRKRIIQSASEEQKKEFREILSIIKVFQTKLAEKKKSFVSYSIISPYLSSMDRILHWNSFSDVYNVYLITKIDAAYKECLSMLRFINQKDLIKEKECSDDVIKQYSNLIRKSSTLKSDLKEDDPVE